MFLGLHSTDSDDFDFYLCFGDSDFIDLELLLISMEFRNLAATDLDLFYFCLCLNVEIVGHLISLCIYLFEDIFKKICNVKHVSSFSNIERVPPREMFKKIFL